MIIIFLLLLIRVLSYMESDCPFSGTYYNEYTGDCDITYGCYDIVEAGEDYWDCDPSTCMYGYYSFEGECLSCTDGAMDCDGDGAISCFDGWYLDGTICQQCSNGFGDGCYTCTDSTCTYCNTGYFSDGGVCFDCEDTTFDGNDDMATSCTFEDDTIIVTECFLGFGLSDVKDCVSCSYSPGYTGYSPGGSHCTIEGSEVTVTACYTGNGFCLGDDNNCHDATSYMTGCSYSTGTYLYTASGCNPGYGLCTDSEGNVGCYSCGIVNSDTCTFTDDNCDVVMSFTCQYEGSLYVSDGVDTCFSCGEGCETCSYDFEEPSCSKNVVMEPYERGYYINGFGLSAQCGYGCHECIDDAECNVCMSVYGEEACYEDDSGDDSDDDDGDDDDDTDDDGDDTDDGDLEEDGANGWRVFFL